MKLIDKLIWVGVLVFYVFLDVGLSAVAFSMGFVEVNPFFTWFNSISLEAFVLVGLVIKVLTVLLMFWVYRLYCSFSCGHWARLLLPGVAFVLGFGLFLRNVFVLL